MEGKKWKIVYRRDEPNGDCCEFVYAEFDTKKDAMASLRLFKKTALPNEKYTLTDNYIGKEE